MISAVRIVFFYFESNQIEYWTIIRNFESNRIVFAVLKSSGVKFVFSCMRTSVAKIQIKFELCVLDPEVHEINLVHYF